MKVLISEDALFKRVARALWRERGERLRRCPVNGRGFNELGRYYTIDPDQRNLVVRAGVDLPELESWGRELGVVKQQECVQQRSEAECRSARATGTGG